MNHKKTIVYADDDFESVGTLIKLRAPALVIGLFLGIGISFIASRFERVVLSHNVQVAFFLPFIVYIANAIGTQTGAIYSRDLKTGGAKFSNYFHKELTLGIIFGTVFGAFSGLVVRWWFQDDALALSVATATFITVTLAPLVALAVAQIFQMIGKDPAAGSGPIVTVTQDMISILIYGIISSLIIL